MTNGNQTYNERLVDLEADLENYIASLSVQPNKHDPVEEILSVNQDELRAMSASECEQNGFVLSQHCITLQIKYNKLYAMIQWVDSQIDDIVTPHLNDYKAYSYDERKKLAIMDNSAAKFLNEKKRELNLKKDSMFGLINKVETVAKFYGEIAKSKKWNK